ncbi:MAG: hypothetical protein NVS3B20_21670 [Polyangiales bacterium]
MGLPFGIDERFLSVSQVAKMFGVADVTIKSWVDSGRLLAARTVGGHRRISASSVVALLAEQGRAIPVELAPAKPWTLLVSHDATVAKALRRAIGERAEVAVNPSIYPALLFAQRVRPKTIVIDADLPGLDPSALIEGLRADIGTRELGLLALSSVAASRMLAFVRTARRLHVPFFRRENLETLVQAVVDQL